MHACMRALLPRHLLPTARTAIGAACGWASCTAATTPTPDTGLGASFLLLCHVCVAMSTPTLRPARPEGATWRPFEHVPLPPQLAFTTWWTEGRQAQRLHVTFVTATRQCLAG